MDSIDRASILACICHGKGTYFQQLLHSPKALRQGRAGSKSPRLTHNNFTSGAKNFSPCANIFV